MSCLPIDYQIDLKTVKFLENLRANDNVITSVLYNWFSTEQLHSLSMRYNLKSGHAQGWSNSVWGRFTRIVQPE